MRRIKLLPGEQKNNGIETPSIEQYSWYECLLKAMLKFPFREDKCWSSRSTIIWWGCMHERGQKADGYACKMELICTVV